MTAVFDWRRFVTIADRVARDFADRTSDMTTHIDASILFSDGVCVCALCEMCDVDQLIEVGTGFGGSTEMFARYFAGHSRVRRIWSIDHAVNPRWQWVRTTLRLPQDGPHLWSTEKGAEQIARSRLSGFAHVTLMRGDAFDQVPPLIRRLSAGGNRLGLFIDGPKGEPQMRLAEQALALSPLVAFAALDDIGPMYDAEQRHARFIASRYAAFATSDPRYFDRYGAVNGARLPRRMIENPAHHGYGVGVLINDARPAAISGGAA